jgi:hypothetical protein
MSEADMHTREGDRNDSPNQVITIDRKIPLPWLLTGAGFLALSLGTMYFDQRRSSEKLNDIAGDVKSIKEDIARKDKQSTEDVYTMRDFQRRLTVVEATLQAQRDQVKGDTQRGR